MVNMSGKDIIDHVPEFGWCQKSGDYTNRDDHEQGCSSKCKFIPDHEYLERRERGDFIESYKVIDQAIKEAYKGFERCSPVTLIVGPSVLHRDPTSLYLSLRMGDKKGKLYAIGKQDDIIETPEGEEIGYVIDKFREDMGHVDVHPPCLIKNIEVKVGDIREMVIPSPHSVDLLFDHKALSYIANYENCMSGTDIDSERRAEEEVVKIYDKLLTNNGRMLLMDINSLNPDLSSETPPNLGQHAIPWLEDNGYELETFEINDAVYFPLPYSVEKDKNACDWILRPADIERTFCRVAVLAKKVF